MTEAEIAALVVEAVAERDAGSSFGDVIVRNGELIVAAFVAVVAGLAFLIGTYFKMRLDIQSLKEYRLSHEAQDKAAHGALESEITGIGRELREFRAESASQHADLGKRVTGMARDLNRLIGFHEAREGLK